MKKFLALISVVLMLAPVMVQPVIASSGSPLPLPIQTGSSSPLITHQNCAGCAGYLGSLPSSGYITKITAQWTVPTVVCQPGLSSDQGISSSVQVYGIISSTGYNTGVALTSNAYCALGSSSPVYSINLAYASASGSIPVFILPFVIIPGHVLSAAISVSPSSGKVTVALKDLTDGQSLSTTTVMSYWGIEYNLMNYAAWLTWRGQPNSWATVPDLALFSPAIKFTACDVVSSGATHPISWLSSLYAYQMVDSSNNVQATLSALNSAGTGFRVTFVSSP